MKSAVRFTVIWLAAWCQVIAVAAVPFGTLVAGLDPLGNPPICHASADAGPPAPAPPARDGHDCVLCLVCQSHGGSVAMLAPPPMPMQRHAVAIARLDVAQPRAPPPATPIAAQPRGPPSPI
jgi:hypothetical protein